MIRTYERSMGLEGAPLNDEAILLDPVTSRFFMLNRTSSFIWERLSTPTTAESLAGEICKTFDNVALPEALNDVRATLDEMLSIGLISSKDSG